VQDYDSIKTEESSGEVLHQIRSAMQEGRLDDAKRLERENLVANHVISTIANSVFDGLLMDHNYLTAIQLGRQYELGADKINDTIIMEFRQLIHKGQVDDAINWGLKHHLPDYEISRAAVKGVEIFLLNGDVSNAVEMKSKYSITNEQLGNMWQKGYDEMFEKGQFYEAALLSREFGSSERKTLLTATKALREAIRSKNWNKIITIDDTFRIFNDESFNLIGDEDAKNVVEVIQGYIRTCLAENRINEMVDVIDGCRILYGFYTNHHMKGLVSFVLKQAIEAHGILLEQNRFKEAQQLRDRMGLLEERVPSEMRKQVMDQALEFHNALLKEKEIDQAKTVKEEYQLLGMYAPSETINKVHTAALECVSQCLRKGEFKKTEYLIDEYNLPTKDVQDQASDDAMQLLDDEKYDTAFNILMEFKISPTDDEMQEKGMKAFEKSMEKGYYELAADIGHVFELKTPKVKEAAKIVWERCMESGDYTKAKMIRRKHRLNKKITRNLATKAYYENMNSNAVDVARKIREEYNISIGFFSWLTELIKTILRLFFKS